MPMEYPGLVTYVLELGICIVFTSLFSIQTTNTSVQFSLGDSKYVAKHVAQYLRYTASILQL